MLAIDHIFYNILGADACMVAARKPQSGLALHSVPSDHKILERVTKSVSHVKGTGNVGRRMNNDELSFVLDTSVRLEFRLEETLLLPPIIPCGLDGNRVVGLEMGVVERSDSLFLALGSVLDVLGNGLLLSLLLLRLLLFRSLGGGGGSLLLLCLELGLLLCLLSFLLHCVIKLETMLFV